MHLLHVLLGSALALVVLATALALVVVVSVRRKLAAVASIPTFDESSFVWGHLPWFTKPDVHKKLAQQQVLLGPIFRLRMAVECVVVVSDPVGYIKGRMGGHTPAGKGHALGFEGARMALHACSTQSRTCRAGHAQAEVARICMRGDDMLDKALAAYNSINVAATGPYTTNLLTSHTDNQWRLLRK
jgi:hypothetical protein